MYSIQDYLLKEKQKKSVFSISTTVKRFFVIDFSLQSFYYKNNLKSTEFKTVCSLRDLKEAKEFEHSNQSVIKIWPYALKIHSIKSSIVLYFDTLEKALKWKQTIDKIIDLNKRVQNFKKLQRSKSQDKFNSNTSSHVEQSQHHLQTIQSVQTNSHQKQQSIINDEEFRSKSALTPFREDFNNVKHQSGANELFFQTDFNKKDRRPSKYVIDLDDNPEEFLRNKRENIQMTHNTQQNNHNRNSDNPYNYQSKQIQRYKFNLNFQNSLDSSDERIKENLFPDNDMIQASSIHTIQEMPASFENSKLSGINIENIQKNYGVEGQIQMSEISFRQDASDLNYSLSKNKINAFQPKKRPQFESEIDVVNTRIRKRQDILRSDVIYPSTSCFGCKIVY
ncbi:UNKNOWN [Stylonychia lemnae]|uniref:PH domain-containing protein n=1 Tax=Stylonychia lemnae TaxID=5949 RepID=A0A077ZT48_STYLE|nr:UNKNOWN [Stylonychia lemnae]|eukprot:CDW71641.1 UNKNOWN [Stylonychia lemnae]